MSKLEQKTTKKDDESLKKEKKSLDKDKNFSKSKKSLEKDKDLQKDTFKEDEKPEKNESNKKQEKLFKCANDINVKITKFSGEVLLCEECCTSLSIILKNDGNVATSFLGSHSPELVKVLERCIKKYFKGLKKTLKEEYNRTDNDEIKVVKDYPKDNDNTDTKKEKHKKEKHRKWLKKQPSFRLFFSFKFSQYPNFLF